jgi:hypothetical protein
MTAMAPRSTCGVALYPEGSVQGVNGQVGFGQQLLELGVLTFELAQSLGVGHVHATVLGPPFVETGASEAALAA